MASSCSSLCRAVTRRTLLSSSHSGACLARRHQILYPSSQLAVNGDMNAVMQSPFSKTQHRNFGLRDYVSKVTGKVNEKIDNSKMKKKRENDKKMINLLLSVEKWTYNDFKTYLESGIEEIGSGWRSYIPGAKDHSGLQDLEQYQLVLSGMREDELTGKRKLYRAREYKLADEVGVPYDVVKDVTAQMRTLSVMHKWLHMRKKENREPPQDMDELMEMMKWDPRGRRSPPAAWQIAYMKNKSKSKHGH